MGFDHRWNLKEPLAKTKSGFVQGNFDQSLLHMEANEFDRELDSYLAVFKDLPLASRTGWVCGLGHGVLPKTPERNVKHFVQRVREVLG
jgi:uroporphyrinogen decarboxylase